MKKLIVTVVIAALAGASSFLLSPLFFDEAVHEPLPGFERVPTRREVDTMSDAEKRRLRGAMAEFARSAPDSTMDEPMPATPQRVAAGRFADADAVHRGSGDALVYRLPDGSHLVRLEDFRVTNGPALVVLLTRADSPKNSQAVTDAGYISLGKLKGNVGNQNYFIPSTADVREFRSVVIWCELFDVLFSAAPLGATASGTAEPGFPGGAIQKS